MLEAQELSGRRGLARLFTGLTFRVEPGTALVITGPNGTGKTTLLRILAGLTAPASGALRWRGAPVAPLASALRAAVAFAGHLPALKDELSTAENLEAMCALGGEMSTAAERRSALDKVGLAARLALPARVLSQGQRRRIGLARLMLTRRPLWILDEPTTALDAGGTELFAAMLRRHLESGGLAVAATHAALGLPAERVVPLGLG